MNEYGYEINRVDFENGYFIDYMKSGRRTRVFYDSMNTVVNIEPLNYGV